MIPCARDRLSPRAPRGNDHPRRGGRLVGHVRPYPRQGDRELQGAVAVLHTKPTAQNTKGGIVKKEAPIAISNVQLWDAKAGKATRVKRDRQNGKLVRISKKSGEVIK